MNDFINDYDDSTLDFDPDFEAMFAMDQARKWKSGEYVDHCKGCAGEDCPCCQYNPDL